MKPNVRTSVAYIAARLISGKSSSTIFDAARGKPMAIAGTVRIGMVDIVEKESKCCIVGSGSGGRYTLKCGKTYIDLAINGASFSGCDQASGKQFNGSVYNTNVSLYDWEDTKSYTYTI